MLNDTSSLKNMKEKNYTSLENYNNMYILSQAVL